MSDTAQQPREGAQDAAFEALLEFIRDNRGFDFTGYKRPSLRRRIDKRVVSLGIDSYADYLAHLEANQDEFVDLFDTILINVTSFFRDPAAWEYLAAEIVPRILESRPAPEPIRVWSAGCASGEEAYTVAVLLAEALDELDFRARVKIYATDVDEQALVQARHGAYARKDVEAVPEPLQDRYFELQDGRYVFRSDVRRAVIFGRHDLVRDPPISRVDLLIARNTLMYFNPELQARILGSFHFALSDGGFLFLGKSEMLLTRTKLFVPVDLKRRVFEKIDGGVERPPRLLPAPADLPPRPAARRVDPLQEAFEAIPVAAFVIDADGLLALANQRARRLFRLTQSDLGRPVQDLELSYRPFDLRSRLEEVDRRAEPVIVRDVEFGRAGEVSWYDVELTPLIGGDGSHVGTSVSFTDSTQLRRLHDSVEATKERLETAYEELQSTSEELETTNEELQSTNEELETTNEELQSTNEELETMNEELQSTNEELETINDELRLRTDELNSSNAVFETVLSGLATAVIVVDAEMRVKSWNGHATELWGLHEPEVLGAHLSGLDIGLPVAEVVGIVGAAIDRGAEGEAELDALNRRGRSFRCRIRVLPLAFSDELGGAIVQAEELPAA